MYDSFQWHIQSLQNKRKCSTLRVLQPTIVYELKHSVSDSLLLSSFLTQESGDVVVDLISVGRVVKLQVDVRAEIILSAKHLETLRKERRAHKHM